MAIKYLNSLNLGKNELQNARIQNLATAPSSPVEGQIYYNTGDNEMYYYDGTAWQSMAGDITSVTAGAGLTGGGTDGAVTLSISSGAITNAMLANSSLTVGAGNGLTGGGSIALGGSGTLNIGAGTGITVNANDVALDTTNDRNVDHSAVTLTAGAGLTGGGDITASRTFTVGAGTGIAVNADDVALSHLGLEALADPNADRILFWDDSAGATAWLSTSSASGLSLSGTTLSLSAIPNSSLTNSSVTYGAGNGLTGGGAVALGGSATFNIGAGTGITVNADSIELSGASSLTSTVLPKWDSGGELVDSLVSDDGSTVTISGNLTVSGTTTTVNTETINLADNIILLNSNEAGAPTQNAGIEIERGTSTNVQFVWDETGDRWDFGASYDVRANAFIGDLEGNADSATIWANARTITLGGDASGSVSIDGSSNVTLTVNVDGVQANSVALGTDTTGNYVATVTTSGALNGSASSEGAALALSVDTATTAQVGVVELATNAEAVAGTDTARAVTPAGVQAHHESKSFASSVGNGVDTDIVVTHNLNSTDVIVQVFEVASGANVFTDTIRQDANNVQLIFAAAPATNEYRVLIYDLR